MSTTTSPAVSVSGELARRLAAAESAAHVANLNLLGFALRDARQCLEGTAGSRDHEWIAAQLLGPVPPAPIDLDKLRHPVYGGVEWRYGRGVGPRGSWPAGPAVSAAKHPDIDGYTATIQQQGWMRDELPGLIAFLSAVFAASTTDPQPELDEDGAGRTDPAGEFYTGCNDGCPDDCMADHRGEE